MAYLHLLSLGTVVPEGPCNVFYASRHQVYSRFDIDDMTFGGILVWCYTHKQIHTQHT